MNLINPQTILTYFLWEGYKFKICRVNTHYCLLVLYRDESLKLLEEIMESEEWMRYLEMDMLF